MAIEMYAGAAGRINVMTVGEGEVLGWSWLFAPYRWKLTLGPLS